MMNKRNHVDVVTLVSGLALLGVAAIGLLVATGATLVRPTMWLASVLLVSGAVGLVLSLRRDLNNR